LYLFLTLLSSGPAIADSTVSFHGTLISGTCSASVVDVDFGEVKLNEVSVSSSQPVTGSGGAGEKNFSLDISCTSALIGTVQYQFKGNASSFNSNAFETDLTGLSVMVVNTPTSASVTPNTWYTLNNGGGSHPMQAVLMRDPSATFKGGNFTATATIEVRIP
jgi:type 1 fimbria pilin